MYIRVVICGNYSVLKLPFYNMFTIIRAGIFRFLFAEKYFSTFETLKGTFEKHNFAKDTQRKIVNDYGLDISIFKMYCTSRFFNLIDYRPQTREMKLRDEWAVCMFSLNDVVKGDVIYVCENGCVVSTTKSRLVLSPHCVLCDSRSVHLLFKMV